MNNWIELNGNNQFLGYDLVPLSDETQVIVVTDTLYPKIAPLTLTVGEAKSFLLDTIRRYRILSLVGAETSQEAQAVEPVIVPVTEPESPEQGDLLTQVEEKPKRKGQKLFSETQEPGDE